MNPTIAVAIPTHNRPQYLQEALASVERQTLKPHEVIIVDDASTPPVDNDAVSALLNVPVRLFRNDASKGLAWNRNKAATAADSQYILHLDDDDWLAPGAIAEISRRLSEHPDTDVVFLTLLGLGSRAEHFNRVQGEGTAKILAQVPSRRLDEHCIAFNGSLVEALLRTVPQAFQHPVVRKDFWSAVTALRFEAYAKANGLASIDEAVPLINGPLRDSEWAIFSAFLEKKVLLLENGLYQMRCEGQGAVSKPEQRCRQSLQGLKIKRTLNNASEHLGPLRPHRTAIRAALRNDLFSIAYTGKLNLPRKEAWSYLVESAKLGPRLAHAKLAFRLLLRR